ncbi:ATP-binding response regulator [Geopsychrobacter electrodiphilus]|uniref:ATP-binding response regulator n=1 Tax=Geopsychrobacter electrodiphilus TaxID=225196 RepID=UPI000376F9D4|nr:response regulator [Geopsychrobacter electrodiphilus]
MELSHRPQPEMTLEQEGKSLLIVDDEPIIRDLCARALKGFKIFQANDGQEAVELLKQQEIDVILSDVMMPNLNGLDLLRRIKEETPNQIVILMTGYTEKEVILQALKAGADDFISKPLNLLHLRTTIDKTFEKQTLKRQISNLRQADKLKSEFLGLISHKLKTPATAISLFIQNIANGVMDYEDPNFRTVLGLVQAETLHMEHLIQDLLYFSQFILDDHPTKLQPLELGKIARQLCTDLAPLAEAKQQNLEVRIQVPFAPTPLRLDRERISFALRALLDNAIKFTPAGGSILVEGQLNGEDATLIIRDTGTGISKPELAKVFSKFYQVDPANSGQVRGFGLGLFYARKFIRSMGGELSLESRPSLGTVATIKLPLN